MSIDTSNVIDIMGSKKGSNTLDLFITDHLPWDEYTNEHLYKLQEKLNYYLAAAEGREIERRFPEHNGKSVVINVLAKYPLSDAAKGLYQKA